MKAPGTHRLTLAVFSDGASSDPSSDWNAPSEAWGNYEEPTTETPLAQEKPLPESSKFIQIGAAVSPPRLRVALHLSQTASAVIPMPSLWGSMRLSAAEQIILGFLLWLTGGR